MVATSRRTTIDSYGLTVSMKFNHLQFRVSSMPTFVKYGISDSDIQHRRMVVSSATTTYNGEWKKRSYMLSGFYSRSDLTSVGSNSVTQSVSLVTSLALTKNIRCGYSISTSGMDEDFSNYIVNEWNANFSAEKFSVGAILKYVTSSVQRDLSGGLRFNYMLNKNFSLDFSAEKRAGPDLIYNPQLADQPIPFSMSLSVNVHW